MSTFSTSRGTRGQHVSPKFQSAPYRQSPARRQHIHGRIRPMHEPSKAEGIFLLYGLIFGLIALYLFAVRP